MSVTPREKVELAAYQHKDVDQVWYEKWMVESPLEKRFGLLRGIQRCFPS